SAFSRKWRRVQPVSPSAPNSRITTLGRSSKLLFVCAQGARSNHGLDLGTGQLANRAETLNTVNFTSVFGEPRNALSLVSDRGCCCCVHHLCFSSRANRQPRGERSA